jgi:hypothetical protein
LRLEDTVGEVDRAAEIRALRHPALSLDSVIWTASFPFELGPRTFTEVVTFPAPAGAVTDETLGTFRDVLNLLHVALGTSYYKVAAPPEVDVTGTGIAEKALPWARALYREGLAEFAYRNGLPHVLEVELIGGADVPTRPPKHFGGRPLVPVGGGKDSIVSVEALRLGGHDPVLFAVNPNSIVLSVMATSGLPALHARRTLDRQLFELNRIGAYNGHVPVTAINSLIAVATAVLHGVGPVVMSNESSASVPNMEWRGIQVNHQWSKGLAAERLLCEALDAQAGLSEAYFSLLRPLSELHIAKLFARITAYDGVVTSCNAAFKLSGRSDRWCGNCPKCRFVFLALAPFTGRSRLIDVFGKDMLDDELQLPGYRELLGLDGHKPFECVGEVEESLIALSLLTAQPEWTGTVALAKLPGEVPADGWPSGDQAARAFGAAGDHQVPTRFAHMLAGLEAAADAGR